MKRTAGPEKWRNGRSMYSKTRGATSLQTRGSDGRWRWPTPVQQQVERMIWHGWTLHRMYCPGLWPDYKYWLESPFEYSPILHSPHLKGRVRRTLNWRTGAALWDCYGMPL